jgi:hypothetical protein
MSGPRRLVFSLALVAALVSLVVIAMVTVALFAPAEEQDKGGPEPMDALLGLLDLHGVLGRQPEERPEAQRDAPVPRERLARFVADLDARDPFLTDLYLGFAVGALARHQGRLFVERQGSRAVISAGDARIALVLTPSGWQVVLEESVPGEIKRRAAEEHRRFLDAQARAAAR